MGEIKSDLFSWKTVLEACEGSMHIGKQAGGRHFLGEFTSQIFKGNLNMMSLP